MSKRLTYTLVDFIDHSLVIYTKYEPEFRDTFAELAESFDVYFASSRTELKELINTVSPSAVIADEPLDIIPPKILYLQTSALGETPELFVKHQLRKTKSPPQTYDLVTTTVGTSPPLADVSPTTEEKDLPELVGKSPAISQAYNIAKKVAPSRVSVHLHGETGTGKEMMARVIHQLSERSNKPMVVVNCSALNPQLLESELFGHEKGAFTGATQRRIGRIEEANGSTLFLDEIGEIDEATQVKLLRVLSDKTLERVGGNQPIPVDFRLVTATHKNLEELVKEGKFREDLYYRIHIVKIEIPPLRDRGIDIISLTKLFLEQFTIENHLPFKPPTEDVIRILLTYRWPGNVRQLKAAIEHALVFSETDMIRVQDLPENIKRQETLDQPDNSLLTVAESDPPEDLNLENIERRTIQKALDLTSNNRAQAAKILGISRRTLYRKIDHYEL